MLWFERPTLPDWSSMNTISRSVSHTGGGRREKGRRGRRLKGGKERGESEGGEREGGERKGERERGEGGREGEREEMGEQEGHMYLVNLLFLLSFVAMAQLFCAVQSSCT